jgi:hypothetical protein
MDAARPLLLQFMEAPSLNVCAGGASEVQAYLLAIKYVKGWHLFSIFFLTRLCY